MLKQFTELRKPVYSLGDWFVRKDIKGCQSIATWREIGDEVSNKGVSVFEEFGAWEVEAFWFPTQNTPNPVLLAFYGSFIT